MNSLNPGVSIARTAEPPVSDHPQCQAYGVVTGGGRLELRPYWVYILPHGNNRDLRHVLNIVFM